MTRIGASRSSYRMRASKLKYFNQWRGRGASCGRAGGARGKAPRAMAAKIVPTLRVEEPTITTDETNESQQRTCPTDGDQHWRRHEAWVDTAQNGRSRRLTSHDRCSTRQMLCGTVTIHAVGRAFRLMLLTRLQFCATRMCLSHGLETFSRAVRQA